jgi:LacI family transcriptional regulator
MGDQEMAKNDSLNSYEGMSVTIKDIARIINMSHTTVSRALNDSPLISDTTKSRVRAIAEEYNYTPNVNARGLVLSKSYNIGLFFSTIKTGTSAGFFMDSVRGVNEVIRDNYSLSVEGIDDFKDLSKISTRFFDGIILMSQSQEDDPFIQHVINQNIPFILLNRELDKLVATTILADDITGAYKATECLIKKGHSRIAIIEGKPEFKNTQRRKEGFLQALRKYHIPYFPEISFRGNYDLDSGYVAMKKILDQEDLPSAVFCFNDDMAVGAMKAINEEGFKIPENISLVGFDDSAYSAYLNPALTSVSRPIEQMCTEGARIILEKIDGVIQKNKTIYLKTELKERDSVRNLK